MARAGILGMMLLVAGGAGACGSPSDPPDSDGGDNPDPDGGGGDAPDAAPTAGLQLVFGSDPALPGSLTGVDFPTLVTEARIDLRDVRAVGDASTGEDTTRAELSLEWGSDGGDDGSGDDAVAGLELSDDDIPVVFPSAPPGYYSHVNADIVDYRVRGTVQVGSSYEFEIDDTPPTPLRVSIPLGDFLLEANTIGVISIHAALRGPVGEVRWDEIEPSGEGELRVDSGSPQISTVREQLAQAFSAEASITAAP